MHLLQKRLSIELGKKGTVVKNSRANLHNYKDKMLYGVDVDSCRIVYGHWTLYRTTGEIMIRYEEQVLFTYYWAATFEVAKQMLVDAVSKRLSAAKAVVERCEAEYLKVLQFTPDAVLGS
jgi:hypothetical protein